MARAEEGVETGEEAVETVAETKRPFQVPSRPSGDVFLEESFSDADGVWDR